LYCEAEDGRHFAAPEPDDHPELQRLWPGYGIDRPRWNPRDEMLTYTSLVHNGVMRTESKTIRQSISLPTGVAARVRSMARSRRVSANRMLVELIEDGMEAQKRKQQQFFELAERFRGASDPEEAKRLGDELGRMVFGD
jgi:hypothetical protein